MSRGRLSLHAEHTLSAQFTRKLIHHSSVRLIFAHSIKVIHSIQAVDCLSMVHPIRNEGNSLFIAASSWKKLARNASSWATSNVNEPCCIKVYMAKNTTIYFHLVLVSLFDWRTDTTDSSTMFNGWLWVAYPSTTVAGRGNQIVRSRLAEACTSAEVNVVECTYIET